MFRLYSVHAESEYEELIRLQAENAYIKAEIEVIKKEIALSDMYPFYWTSSERGIFMTIYYI